MATSTAKQNEILSDMIQSYLGGAEPRLTKLFMDLSSRATQGRDKISVPKVTGLSVKNVVAGGSGQADQTVDTALAVTLDEIDLSQFKEIPEYISETLSIESKVDLKVAFKMVAPRKWVEGIENAIYADLLANTNPANFNSGTLNSFDVADFSRAKKIMDKAGIPLTERYAILNADGMEILAGTTEFEDGSKSLSAEALKQGIVSVVKGFQVVQFDTSTSASNKIVFAHGSALAYANQKQVEYIEEKQRSKAHEFISLRGKYGTKLLDSGLRAIVLTMAV